MDAYVTTVSNYLFLSDELQEEIRQFEQTMKKRVERQGHLLMPGPRELLTKRYAKGEKGSTTEEQVPAIRLVRYLDEHDVIAEAGELQPLEKMARTRFGLDAVLYALKELGFEYEETEQVSKRLRMPTILLRDFASYESARVQGIEYARITDELQAEVQSAEAWVRKNLEKYGDELPNQYSSALRRRYVQQRNIDTGLHVQAVKALEYVVIHKSIGTTQSHEPLRLLNQISDKPVDVILKWCREIGFEFMSLGAIRNAYGLSKRDILGLGITPVNIQGVDYVRISDERFKRAVD